MSNGLPLSYFIATGICFLITLFSAVNYKKLWAMPVLAVMAMYILWYVFEPFYFPEEFVNFTASTISDAYYYCCVFLLSFVAFFLFLRQSFTPRQTASVAELQVDLAGWSHRASEFVGRLVVPLTIAWVILVAIGTLRLGGDLFGALFPLEGRAGVVMWQRGAAGSAGATGFLVSTGGYIYLMLSAFFGALLPLARTPGNRLTLFVLLCLAWPYHFLQGSRSEALIASLPFVVSFLMFSRFSFAFKAFCVLAVAAFFNFWFAVVLEMRLEQASLTEISMDRDIRHFGLNMASELCWMLTFQGSGILQPSWGMRYLAEALNFVPRAIWPGKPLIGIDYAIARGFGASGNDIGVFATISTGVIGQGIANFGPFFGSAFAGFAMSCWANLLCRLRQQGGLARLLLFVFGIGVTINLGRDITLLTLFPFVFAYLAILIIEFREGRRTAGLAANSYSRRTYRRRGVLK